jgi:hypothetical protein
MVYGWTHCRRSAMLAVGGYAMRQKYHRQRPDDLISAQEIACFAYWK